MHKLISISDNETIHYLEFEKGEALDAVLKDVFLRDYGRIILLQKSKSFVCCPL